MYCNFEYGLTEKVTFVSEPQGGREASQAGILAKGVLSRRNSKSTMSAVEIHSVFSVAGGEGARMVAGRGEG